MPEDSCGPQRRLDTAARLPGQNLFTKQGSCAAKVLCELAFGLGGVHAVAGDGCQLLAAVVLIVDVVGDVFEILHVGPAIVETLVRLGRCPMGKNQEKNSKDQPEEALLLQEIAKLNPKSVSFHTFLLKAKEK